MMSLRTNFAEEIWLTTFNLSLFRSSRPEVFCKIVVFKNFEKFTREHLYLRLFFNKVAGRRRPSIIVFLFDLFAYNYDKFIVKNRENVLVNLKIAYSINSLANKSFRGLNQLTYISFIRRKFLRERSVRCFTFMPGQLVSIYFIHRFVFPLRNPIRKSSNFSQSVTQEPITILVIPILIQKFIRCQFHWKYYIFQNTSIPQNGIPSSSNYLVIPTETDRDTPNKLFLGGIPIQVCYCF